MSALLHYLTLMEHAYLRCVLDGRQAVGYHQRCTILHQPLQRLLHKLLALAVESRGRLVREKYGRRLTKVADADRLTDGSRGHRYWCHSHAP